jgi:hypothetical protein
VPPDQAPLTTVTAPPRVGPGRPAASTRRQLQLPADDNGQVSQSAGAARSLSYRPNILTNRPDAVGSAARADTLSLSWRGRRPVDTMAAFSTENFRQCRELATADDERTR